MPADPIERAYVARALAVAMPWYLDFLAVWMLNYERRRLEAMIREMCESITAFAKATMRPPKPATVGVDWGFLNTSSPFDAVGLLMAGVASAKAAKQAQMNAVQRSNDLARHLYGLGQQHPYTQHRSGLQNASGNIFNGL